MYLTDKNLKFGIFDQYGALNSDMIFRAFTESLAQRNISYQSHDLEADVAVIWSVLWSGRMALNQSVWRRFRESNKPVIVLEVGALKRNTTWRVGVNGINASGYFGPTGMDSSRAERLGLKLYPWRTQGDHILICLQRNDSQQWEGMPDIAEWTKCTVDTIRKYSNRPILVRCHPRQATSIKNLPVDIVVPKKIPGTYDEYDLSVHLNNAWAVINWNSNPAVDAVIQGIPVFVGPGSRAAPVGNLDLASIEDPWMPDRQQWINDLAWTEWTVKEIQRGEPIDRLWSFLTQPGQAFI